MRTHDLVDPWRVAPDRLVDLSSPVVMGILNVTPDSFHDGGQFSNPHQALLRAVEMSTEGAAIIDVGGESTRPGAQRVDVTEQIDRTASVIELICKELDCVVSIDTTRSAVAAAALQAGADVINDVSAGLEDSSILDLAATQRSGIVLMHRLAEPEVDSYSNEYDSEPDYGSVGVVQAVQVFLRERRREAIDRGIAEQNIVLDPGLGFGKSVEQNLALLGGISEIAREGGAPMLIGASRKSFIGAITGANMPNERLFGSLAAAVIAAIQGASIIRTHDVRATVDALAVAGAAGANFKLAPDTMS